MNPELLRWARETAGLSHRRLAEKLKVSVDRLREWERGDAAPSVAKLRQVAKACKRPLLVFYLPEPPKGFDAMRDYRRLDPKGATPQSPGLTFEIRRAHERREVATELAVLLGEAAASIATRAAPDDDPDTIAASVRRELGVEVETQLEWGGSFTALRAWREALEALGILVFQTTGVEVTEARAFSIVETPTPVIAINGSDSANGRVFSLMHELGHLALQRGGQCTPVLDDRGEDERARTEVFCNAFAGCLLVPAGALGQHATVRSHGRSNEWSNDELGELARAFSVSPEAVLRRLLAMGRTTTSFYQRMRREFGRQTAAQPRGGNYYRTQVARLGRQYIRLVFSGLAEGRIGEIDAADYLEVKIKNFVGLRVAALGEVAPA